MSRSSSAIEQQFTYRPPSRGGAVDGRSPVGRRRLELMNVYGAALGGLAGLSAGQVIDVRRAAELTALAEAERSKAMQHGVGDAAALSALIRLESTAARAVRALNIKPGKAGEPVADLAAYLASKAAGGGP